MNLDLLENYDTSLTGYHLLIIKKYVELGITSINRIYEKILILQNIKSKQLNDMQLTTIYLYQSKFLLNLIAFL